jgi:competence protein ComEC
MYLPFVAFVAGAALLCTRPEIPSAALLLGCAALGLLPLARCRRRLCLAVAALAIGFVYAALRAQIAGLPDGLPEALQGRDLMAEGRVVALPVEDPVRARFELKLERLIHDGAEVPFQGRLRLSWYGAPRTPVPGERWRLQVRLKRPHGFSNPGGSDYEGWLFRAGIRATGYVRACDCNRRLAETTGWLTPDRWRYAIREDLRRLLPDPGARGLVAALAIGDRSGFPAGLWEALRRTGTSHLVAISGLHVGLVSGLAYLIGSWLWRRLGRLALYVPAPSAGALAGLAAALLYAALAGFAIPTQRALIMVGVALGAVLLRRRIRPAALLATALVLVVVRDPFSVLSAGFWLSFAAVAVLVYTMGFRAAQPPAWRQWGRMQWVLALGLAPLAIGWFQQASLVAPAANLLAVPWFSLVLVPLVLLSVLLAWAVPALAPAPMVLLDLLARATVAALEWAGSGALAAVHTETVAPWILATAGLGAVVIMAPAGVPGRWLGLLLCLPLLIHEPDPVPHGAYELTLLDVGQGLAVVVRTRGHTLVYDTGPRYSERFDTGRAVVVPFLRSAGRRRVDLLVVSHGANDHAGGLRSVLEAVQVERVIGGEPDALGTVGAQRCVAGQAWQWDGVDFEVLWPPAGSPWRDNNASCVLRVAGEGGTALLTGDLEAEGERRLVRSRRADLRADLVQVPHHGSLTSSTPVLVEAAKARYALVASGYRNRFGFPRPEVATRWTEAGARLLDTARTGAISVLAR